jgi:hypothetical protein
MLTTALGWILTTLPVVLTWIFLFKALEVVKYLWEALAEGSGFWHAVWTNIKMWGSAALAIIIIGQWSVPFIEQHLWIPLMEQIPASRPYTDTAEVLYEVAGAGDQTLDSLGKALKREGEVAVPTARPLPIGSPTPSGNWDDPSREDAPQVVPMPPEEGEQPQEVPAGECWLEPVHGTSTLVQWADWYDGQKKGFPQEKRDASLYDIPDEVKCQGEAITKWNWLKTVETEEYQFHCRHPQYPEWGSATIEFSGLAAEVYGVQGGESDKFDGEGEWPPGFFRKVCPTPKPTPIPTVRPPNEGVPDTGSGVTPTDTPEPTSNTWYKVKVAGLNCRKGPGTGYASYGAISKGGEVRSRPRDSTEPEAVGNWKPVTWGAVKCWINTSSKYVTVFQK